MCALVAVAVLPCTFSLMARPLSVGVLLLAALAVVLPPRQAEAWSAAGHAVVGSFAREALAKRGGEGHLTYAAAAERARGVLASLAPVAANATDLDGAAVWMDVRRHASGSSACARAMGS